MLFGISVYAFGKGDDQVEPVARVIEKIAAAGLPYRTHAMQTVVEGNWDRVMPVLKEAHEELTDEYDRVFLSVSLDHHRGKGDRLEGAVGDVEDELGHPV